METEQIEKETVQEPEQQSGSPKKNGKVNKNVVKWIWIAVAVLAIIGIAVWCILAPKKSEAGVADVIHVPQTVALLFGMFLITMVGCLLGRVTIKGISLGTAGVFLIAILFGYLSTLEGLKEIPILNMFYMENTSSKLCGYYKSIVQNIGLVLFVSSVGCIAGPNFFKDLKRNAKSYVVLGVMIIVTGAIIATLFALIPGIKPEFSAGVLSGSLTTTPGYSAALEAAASGEFTDLVTLGYAVAYPFGVVGVVLFVQLIPKITKTDMVKERAMLRVDEKSIKVKKEGLFQVDSFGLMPFGLAVVVGLILGSITIPLTSKGYNGPTFSLGTTGGTLISCLVFGHFGHIGKLDMEVPERTTKVFREFGLVLFLIGAGVSGGVALVDQIRLHGGIIILYGFLAGALMTTLPMVIGYIFARKVLKMSLLNTLGSITGGMTSTPALGTLIATAGTDDVAGAYASTYPIALVLVVLASQLIITLL